MARLPLARSNSSASAPTGKGALSPPLFCYGARIMDQITYDDFTKVDIRVGTILEAAPQEGARKPALRLSIDFGPELGIRKSSAQLTVHYTPESLVGRQVAAVVNFPPRQIGKFMSPGLTLGVPADDGSAGLFLPDKKVPNDRSLVHPAAELRDT